MVLYLYQCWRCCWTETLDIKVATRDEKQWCQACRENSLSRKGWAIRPEGWHKNKDGVVTIRKV